jgi:hypothetical protein
MGASLSRLDFHVFAARALSPFSQLVYSNLLAMSNLPQLRRVVGPFSLTAIGVNGLVGARIFWMPSTVAALLGRASLIAYLVVKCFAIAWILSEPVVVSAPVHLRTFRSLAFLWQVLARWGRQPKIA